MNKRAIKLLMLALAVTTLASLMSPVFATAAPLDAKQAEAARGIDSPPSLLRASAGNLAAAQRRLAERKGFEPSIRVIPV